jgi:hypothetical protein
MWDISKSFSGTKWSHPYINVFAFWASESCIREKNRRRPIKKNKNRNTCSMNFRQQNNMEFPAKETSVDHRVGNKKPNRYYKNFFHGHSPKC